MSTSPQKKQRIERPRKPQIPRRRFRDTSLHHIIPTTEPVWLRTLASLILTKVIWHHRSSICPTRHSWGLGAVGPILYRQQDSSKNRTQDGFCQGHSGTHSLQLDPQATLLGLKVVPLRAPLSYQGIEDQWCAGCQRRSNTSIKWPMTERHCQRPLDLLMLWSITLQGHLRHFGLIGDREIVSRAKALIHELVLLMNREKRRLLNIHMRDWIA